MRNRYESFEPKNDKLVISQNEHGKITLSPDALTAHQADVVHQGVPVFDDETKTRAALPPSEEDVVDAQLIEDEK